MKRTTYKLATNFCLVVAAASVILFDRFPQLHWLTGGLLVGAGLAATAVHFYVQWRPVQTVERAPEETVADQFDGFLTPIGKALEPVCVPIAETASAPDLGIDLGKVFVKFAISYPPRQRIDADIVAQVCEKLAATETDFEVTLTGEGDLTIRPSRQKQQPGVFGDMDLAYSSSKGDGGPSNLVN
jgi:hypothetical protein